MITKERERLNEMIDKLYMVNSYISGHFVTKLQKINYNAVCNINKLLSEMIKQFREFMEKSNEI